MACSGGSTDEPYDSERPGRITCPNRGGEGEPSPQPPQSIITYPTTTTSITAAIITITIPSTIFTISTLRRAHARQAWPSSLHPPGCLVSPSPSLLGFRSNQFPPTHNLACIPQFASHQDCSYSPVSNSHIARHHLHLATTASIISPSLLPHNPSPTPSWRCA